MAVLAVPCCGLGNRVRTIIGAVLYARSRAPDHQAPQSIVVVWRPAADCGSPYARLFMSHPAFNVIDHHVWRTTFSECDADASCVSWARAGGGSGTCTSSSTHYNMGATLAAAGAALPTAVFRGCGLRFEHDDDDTARQCAALVHDFHPHREVKATVAALLPANPKEVVGVHLRSPDADSDLGAIGPMVRRKVDVLDGGGGGGGGTVAATTSKGGVDRSSGTSDATVQPGGSPVTGLPGRRLSQGKAECHPVRLFVKAVVEEWQQSPRLTTVYVASGSKAYLEEFRQGLHRAVAEAATPPLSTGSAPAHPRPPPRVLSLADLLAVPVVAAPAAASNASSFSSAHAHEHGWPGSADLGSMARNNTNGMLGAVLDLWALASTSKLFRAGESTFGMLAAALHKRPVEVLVRDRERPECKVWGAMFPGGNSTTQWPAFCAPTRGKEPPKTCECTADCMC